MFVRTTLVALVLASPAWAGPDYPAGLFERSPLNDTPPAASRRGIIPPDKRKTRPESAPAGAAIIIASGAIHGRNHAEPIVHPHIFGESGRLSARRVARSPIVRSPALKRAARAWSSDMKDRTADVLMPFATLCAEGVFDICSHRAGEAIDQSWP
jgi:hypothetical protein